MKPTLVDNCEHYNYQTHNCNKCGRGLPDVCLDYEEMKRKAEAYEATQGATSTEPRNTHQGNLDTLHALQVDTEQAQEPKKARGRPRKVTE